MTRQNTSACVSDDGCVWTKFLTDPVPGRLPPPNSFGARHKYFMRGHSCEVVLRGSLRIASAGVGAAPVPVRPHLQVGDGEGFGAKTWRQVLESGDVFVHDLVGAQPPLIHRVLLEGPHKVRKHPMDPEFCQYVVFGNVLGERPWNTVEEAGIKTKTYDHVALNPVIMIQI